METKYYNPELSDLFVGYECEIEGSIREENNVWYKIKIDSLPRPVNIDLNKIRTKFLDKQDIESEGWKITNKKHPFLGDRVDSFIKKREEVGFNVVSEYLLFKHPNSSILEIHNIYRDSYVGINEQVFSGECKSINEFRKITKWLNIK